LAFTFQRLARNLKRWRIKLVKGCARAFTKCVMSSECWAMTTVKPKTNGVNAWTYETTASDLLLNSPRTASYDLRHIREVHP